MIFEWRTYRFAPGRAAAYLAAFQSEGLPLVTRHLPLLGWLTESGRLNVLHHLWVYANLDDRAACRASLAADADWTAGVGPRAFPMIEAQHTLLLTALARSPRLSAAVETARAARPALAADAPLLASSWAMLEITEGPSGHPPAAEPVAAWQVTSGERPRATSGSCAAILPPGSRPNRARRCAAR